MRTKKNKQATRKHPDYGKILQDPADQAKRLEWVFMGVLLVMGVFLSLIYFGQKAVPNSDFTAFVQTGRDILHFRMPSSFKRVPMLGVLQVAAGQFMFTSPHPILTGALVLNGILYTLSILLLYKVSRFFIAPTGSFCLSLLAAVNPWALVMVVDPIAETTIVFFILLTLYLILSRSQWCYLAAMLASMTRYECFGLIGIALLFDLFSHQPKRHKLTAVGIAFAASVPMVLWIIGTKLTSTNPNSTYFKHFLNVDRNGLDFLKMLWMTSFSSLLQWPEYIRAVLIERPASQQAAEAIQSHKSLFQFLWNVVMAVFFVLGVIGVFLKKQWRFMGILLFWAGYVGIHMSQGVLIDRYTLPVVWLTLLTAMYGLSNLTDRLPRAILSVIAVITSIIALFWTFQLWPALSQTVKISPASGSVVYAGLLLVAVGLVGKSLICHGRGAMLDGCLFVVVALMIVSNQFPLSMRLGQGDLDIEFRRTAEWYLENTDGTEKLATTLPGVVNLFLPEGQKKAIHTSGIAGKDIMEFAQSCKQRQVRYVAWDSRLGFAVRDAYYKNWGLNKIHPLGSGKDVGPFKFITKIPASQRRYILLYKVELERIPDS
ncbi:MAG: glycosyltransferase family protein [Planctomycetota bacterium]